jgi:general secretion pathway protein D
VDNEKSGIPLLSSLPLIGGVFSYQRDAVEKTELLVFLRPTVVNNASLNADLKQFRRYLPEPLPPQTQPVSSPPSGQEIGL